MIDKMTIARRKCARGTLLTVLYDNQTAAVILRSLEYAMMADDPHISSEIGSRIRALSASS